MQIGLIGCGNMARALARGWCRPLLCADPVAERARSLAAEVGGEALAHNAEVAARADLVVLCHKPGQLAAVAGEIAPQAKSVVSILAATPLEAVRNVYPGKPVYRFIPSLPVDVLHEALLDVAMGLMSCGPAYVALVAEAQVDAGVRRGIPAAEGASLVVQTLARTAELLRRRDTDTVTIRREVASPGGLTARGLDALERGGLRAAFSDAMDAVLERDRA